MSEIRIKSEGEQTAPKKKSGETLDVAKLREELKAEILAELGLHTLQNKKQTLGETPMSVLADMVKAQSGRFKDLNPIVEGEYFELRRGEKLIRVRSKQDGTRVFDYLGRVSKPGFAKEQFELAKKSGKLQYR